MLPTLTNKTLQTIQAKRPNMAISIFFPTSDQANFQDINRINYHNALKEIKSQLPESWSSEDRERLIGRLKQPEEQISSEGRQGSIVVYSDGKDTHVYFTTMYIPPTALIGDRYVTDIATPASTTDEHYYVLALSQKDARLFDGTSTGLEQLELAQIRGGMRQVLMIDELPKQLQGHSTGSNGEGFHGHDPFKDEHKQHIANYLRKIDQHLDSVFKNRKAPVVLVGVGYLLSIYRRVSKHGDLLVDAIHGNPDRSSAHALFQRTWPVAQQHLQ